MSSLQHCHGANSHILLKENKMKTQIILLATLLSPFTILGTTWGQIPPSQPPSAKVGIPSSPQTPRILHFSTPDASDFVLLSTGKSPVDKEAVRARQEADAEGYQAVRAGEAHFKAGRIKEAIAAYKNALSITPTDSLAYQRLAEADMACGKLEEASQNFHKILVEGFGPGIPSGVSGNQEVWAEYALVLVKTKRHADALRAYNRAALIADYEIDQNDPSKLNAHLTVMFPEIVTGDARLDQVQYTPERLQALTDILLAHTLSGFRSYKEIKAYAQEAVKMYPDSAAVQYYLGNALSGSYYGYLDSSAKDKPAALAACEEDKKGEAAAYKKAADLGDDKTKAAAKERAAMIR